MVGDSTDTTEYCVRWLSLRSGAKGYGDIMPPGMLAHFVKQQRSRTKTELPHAKMIYDAVMRKSKADPWVMIPVAELEAIASEKK